MTQIWTETWNYCISLCFLSQKPSHLLQDFLQSFSRPCRAGNQCPPSISDVFQLHGCEDLSVLYLSRGHSAFDIQFVPQNNQRNLTQVVRTQHCP